MKLFRDNIHHENRVKKLSFKLNISEEIIEETLDIMYGYIRTKFDNVELEDKTKKMTEEEFNKTFPIISIPKLGFFKPSYRKYLHIIKNVRKNIKKSRIRSTTECKEN